MYCPKCGLETYLCECSLSPQEEDYCYHVWEHYMGFTHAYWYCTECSAKLYEKP